MSYKHRLYVLDKSLLSRISDMNKDQFYAWALEQGIINADDFEDGDPYVPLYKIGKEFFDFGKYYENAAQIKETGEPLFEDEYLSNSYDHYSPHVVGKEAILNAINYQRDQIIGVYEKMLFLTDEQRKEMDLDDRSREKVYEDHIKNMYREWKNDIGHVFAFNLSSKTEEITTSWKYEYSIFELVRLYKSTNWDDKALIFMGW